MYPNCAYETRFVRVDMRIWRCYYYHPRLPNDQTWIGYIIRSKGGYYFERFYEMQSHPNLISVFDTIEECIEYVKLITDTTNITGPLERTRSHPLEKLRRGIHGYQIH